MTGYNQKGCSKTYNLLMEYNQNIITDIKNKWDISLSDDIPNEKIMKSFILLHKMKEGSFAKYFQFKMLHMRIVTNKKLQIMGIRNDSQCPYCDEQVETIEHAFLECEAAKEIWKEVETWLKTSINTTIKISNLDKIFGTGMEHDIVEKTIIATKRVIYRHRQKGTQYTLREVKTILRSQLTVGEYQSGIEGNYHLFLKTWGTIYNFIVKKKRE